MTGIHGLTEGNYSFQPGYDSASTLEDPRPNENDRALKKIAFAEEWYEEQHSCIYGRKLRIIKEMNSLRDNGRINEEDYDCFRRKLNEKFAPILKKIEDEKARMIKQALAEVGARSEEEVLSRLKVERIF